MMGNEDWTEKREDGAIRFLLLVGHGREEADGRGCRPTRTEKWSVLRRGMCCCEAEQMVGHGKKEESESCAIDAFAVLLARFTPLLDVGESVSHGL